MTGRLHKSKKVYERGTFSEKMVYKRVRGWTSGRSLPIYDFFEYPPAGGGKIQPTDIL